MVISVVKIEKLYKFIEYFFSRLDGKAKRFLEPALIPTKKSFWISNAESLFPNRYYFGLSRQLIIKI